MAKHEYLAIGETEIGMGIPGMVGCPDVYARRKRWHRAS